MPDRPILRKLRSLLEWAAVAAAAALVIRGIDAIRSFVWDLLP